MQKAALCALVDLHLMGIDCRSTGKIGTHTGQQTSNVVSCERDGREPWTDPYSDNGYDAVDVDGLICIHISHLCTTPE